MTGFSYELRISENERHALNEKIKKGVEKLTGVKVRLSFPFDGEKLVCLAFNEDEMLEAIGEGYYVPEGFGGSKYKMRVYVDTLRLKGEPS